MLRELRRELRGIREILDPHSNPFIFIIDMREPGDDRPDEGWVPGPDDVLLDLGGPSKRQSDLPYRESTCGWICGNPVIRVDKCHYLTMI